MLSFLFFCLVSANVHHFSFYPCLPRAPEIRYVSFYPPSKESRAVVPRDFPAVAERTVMGFVYVLPFGGPKLRLLWLFNRAFGLQTNGTLLQVVWKDSVDTAHPDRELNITGVKYEKKWCVVFCSSPDQFAEPLGSYYNSLLGDAGASCY